MNKRRRIASIAIPLIVLLFAIHAPIAQAQFVEWADETASRLDADSPVGVDDPEEKDYAAADLDLDGDTDLICVRKEPFSTPGGRRNVLFMNVDGVLTDQTAEYSLDMLDQTNDRDVVIADFNGDAWPDFVTVTTKGADVPDPPENIRQPRIYINLGDDPNGDWLGFDYEPARMPLFAPAPGFCEAGAGDLDGDGAPDIYFVDYSGRYSSQDLNDRLVMNDGMGFFADETAARIGDTIPPGVPATFGHCAEICDMNADGHADIIREVSQDPGNNIRIAYNDGTGNFLESEVIYTNAPYFLVIADYDNDSTPDMYVCDDGQDRYVLNQGAGDDGMADFSNEILITNSPDTTFFGGTSHAADFDGDGWTDLVVGQNDVEFYDCSRPLVLLQNLGNPPDVELTDPNGGEPQFWLPAAPHDAMPIDIDSDGFLDLVVGTCFGTHVFMNQPPAQMFFTYPDGLPESALPDEPATFVFQVDWTLSQPDPATATLHYKTNNGAWSTLAAEPIGDDGFLATLPGAACGDRTRFYVSIANEEGTTFIDPPTSPVGAHALYSAYAQSVPIEDDFETELAGWQIENDASLTGGAWTRVNPIGTELAGVTCQPEDDYDADGLKCYVTGQGVPGGGAAVADVDGGPTMLISPVIDLADADAYVTYARWFFRFSGTSDALKVEVTSNGLDWVQVESVTANEDEWVLKTFRVSQFVAPTAAVQVRFVIADNPANSITEGGIDAFKVVKLDCIPPCLPGDADGNGVVDADDVDEFVAALVASDPQPACGSDVNADSEINGDDIAAMVALLIGS